LTQATTSDGTTLEKKKTEGVFKVAWVRPVSTKTLSKGGRATFLAFTVSYVGTVAPAIQVYNNRFAIPSDTALGGSNDGAAVPS
jgi:hypothetical protein